MATCFFLGVGAAGVGPDGTWTPPGDAALAEAGIMILLGTDPVLTGLLGIAEALPAGAWLASGTGGRVERGVATGVLRGLLRPADPWAFLRGEGGRLGCSLLTEESLRDVVRTASGPTAR